MNQLESIIDFALEVGGLMLASNSEIYRCEQITYHVLKAYKVEDINIFTLSSSIYLTASKQGETITRIKRVYQSETNLTMISELNQLSRDITNYHIPLEEAKHKLDQIKQITLPKDILKCLSISFSCVAFGYMFNTFITPVEALAIFIITILSYYLTKLLNMGKMNLFIVNFLVANFMTITTIACYDLNMIRDIDHVIIGTIMYLVPGVALTNCIRDMLNGDILSGTVRLVECLIVGLAIASGVFVALYLYKRGGGI